MEVCISTIEDRGLDSQGIYRIPGNAGVVHELQEQLDHVSIEALSVTLYQHHQRLGCIYIDTSMSPALYWFPYISFGKHESACISMVVDHIHTSTGYL